MLAAVRRSLSRLGDASALVGDYVRVAGSRPRAASATASANRDLYYTVFGLELLEALDAPLPPATAPYLLGFGLGDDLDLVHLSCLIRARTGAGRPVSDVETDAPGCAPRELPERRRRLRSDAGFGHGIGLRLLPGGGGLRGPGPRAAVDRRPSLAAWRRCGPATAGYGNLPRPGRRPDADDGGGRDAAAVAGRGVPAGLDGVAPRDASSRTAASSRFRARRFRICSRRPPRSTRCPCMGVPLDALREPCLDFVRSLWTGEGAFAGSWADPTPDCEYTYYGLLALGHLRRMTTARIAMRTLARLTRAPAAGPQRKRALDGRAVQQRPLDGHGRHRAAPGRRARPARAAAGLDWLERTQNPDGGFGDTVGSAEQPEHERALLGGLLGPRTPGDGP